ncbi:hypothetical protein LCGC14_1635010 [marine sediment metagenome]|uniref:Uncharacterized protein n=1 Tax=marine sediment metagenome TaxID=412755 RepID=A0A0F9INP4_9ZZZZ
MPQNSQFSLLLNFLYDNFEFKIPGNLVIDQVKEEFDILSSLLTPEEVKKK